MRVLTISGPSGSGKTFLANALLSACPDGFRKCITTTTRMQREGEQDGREYHFVTESEFEAELAAGSFLESSKINGSRYGMTAAALADACHEGRVGVFVCDPLGARATRRFLARAGGTSIGVLVGHQPSVLERRIRARDPSARPDVIASRISWLREHELAWMADDAAYDHSELRFDERSSGPLVLTLVERASSWS